MLCLFKRTLGQDLLAAGALLRVWLRCLQAWGRLRFLFPGCRAVVSWSLGKEWLPFMVEFVAGLGVQPRGAGGLVLITERDGNPTRLVQTGRGGGKTFSLRVSGHPCQALEGRQEPFDCMSTLGAETLETAPSRAGRMCPQELRARWDPRSKAGHRLNNTDEGGVDRGVAPCTPEVPSGRQCGYFSNLSLHLLIWEMGRMTLGS